MRWNALRGIRRDCTRDASFLKPTLHTTVQSVGFGEKKGTSWRYISVQTEYRIVAVTPPGSICTASSHIPRRRRCMSQTMRIGTALDEKTVCVDVFGSATLSAVESSSFKNIGQGGAASYVTYGGLYGSSYSRGKPPANVPGAATSQRIFRCLPLSGYPQTPSSRETRQ